MRLTIENKDCILCFGGHNTVSLAKKYGTRLYFYSETEIINRIYELKHSFIEKYKNTRVGYAAKAFSAKVIFRIMEREDISMDVASGGELYTAIAAGFLVGIIEFNGNSKLTEELERVIDYGVGIIIDALQYDIWSKK
jgi:diaminopimelate decarboxylase